MSNSFRKHGASGGRVGYGEGKGAGLSDAKSLPPAAATRQKPLPTPPPGTKPMQPPSPNKASNKKGY